DSVRLYISGAVHRSRPDFRSGFQPAARQRSVSHRGLSHAAIRSGFRLRPGSSRQSIFYRQDGVRMRLGRRLNNRKKDLGYDVPRPEEPDPTRPREDESEKALIGDPRNDENVIIAQLHAVFLQFHNRVVDELQKQTGITPTF